MFNYKIKKEKGMKRLDDHSHEYQKVIHVYDTYYNGGLSKNQKQLELYLINEAKLHVKMDDKAMHVEAPHLPGILRGVGELIRKEREGLLTYEASSDIYFDFNGVMVDCSRNGVLNLDYAKELIRTMACMGHTVMMLYMEDVYEVEGEAYFGYLRGKYTKKELTQLDDYAYDHGVELIPCIQALAHLEQFLAWERTKSAYVDIDNILYVGSDKVNALLERMIKQLATTFRSRRIHMGMDEAYNLGRGRYADEHGLVPKTEIMHQHLNFMLQLAKKYDLKPMIWDDMFFSSYSKADTDVFKIPEGIDLVYWDYYNNFEEHYAQNLQLRKKIAHEVIFAGGAWRWMGYGPHHGKTLVTTKAALSACKKADIRQVIATSWADDGCECPVSPLLLGLQLFADHGYSFEVDEDEYKKRLLFHTGMSFEEFMKQQELNVYPEFNNSAATVTPGKYGFYEDVLLSPFVVHTQSVKEDLTKRFIQMEAFFDASAKKQTNLVLKKTQEFYREMYGFMAYKWDLGLLIYQAYHEHDMKKMETIIQSKLNEAIVRIDRVLEARREEWELTNKEIGFEVLEIRMAGIKQRLISAKRKLVQWTQGEIDHIASLDEVRLPVVDGRDEGVGDVIHFNNSIRSMTTGKIGWH